jgi:AraC-like DNA-binding protein
MQNRIPTRIVIVEANARERRRLEKAIDRTPDYCCGGSYTNGAEALPGIRQARPPIVLLDWLTPLTDGFSVFRELRRHIPGIRIVMMADGDGETTMSIAKGLQASGLWVKPCAVASLLTALDGLAPRCFLRGRGACWTSVPTAPTLPFDLASPPPHLWAVLNEFRSRPEGEGIGAAIAAAAHYRVPELARLFQASLRQLDRRFMAVFGLTPQNWLTHHRMLAARKMLEAGYSCKDCASELGYNHASNFCSAFLRYHGARPRHFIPANGCMV